MTKFIAYFIVFILRYCLSRCNSDSLSYFPITASNLIIDEGKTYTPTLKKYALCLDNVDRTRLKKMTLSRVE